MELASITSNVASSVADVGARTLDGLTGDDFLKLLISQLTNQDPLEPMDNQELLQQISSIRDLEVSATLTESLQKLTGQQQYGAVSALIGQYVTSATAADGTVASGIVVGVRFEADGQPVLQLSDGTEVAFDAVSTIESPHSAGEALMGQTIVGVDKRDPAEPEVVEGTVTGVRIGENGEVLLELDTGEDLRLQDYTSLAVPVA